MNAPKPHKHHTYPSQVYVKDGKGYRLDKQQPNIQEMANKYKEEFGTSQKKGKPLMYYEAKLGGGRPPHPTQIYTDLDSHINDKIDMATTMLIPGGSGHVVDKMVASGAAEEYLPHGISMISFPEVINGTKEGSRDTAEVAKVKRAALYSFCTEAPWLYTDT